MEKQYPAHCIFCAADAPEQDGEGRYIVSADEARATMLCAVLEHRSFMSEQIGDMVSGPA